MLHRESTDEFDVRGLLFFDFFVDTSAVSMHRKHPTPMYPTQQKLGAGLETLSTNNPESPVVSVTFETPNPKVYVPLSVL